MKFRSLNGCLIIFSSVFAMRSIFFLYASIGMYMIGTCLFDEGEQFLGKMYFGALSLSLSYFVSLFSSVNYNDREIVVQNVWGKFVYEKNKFREIKPWKSYINIYIIIFEDQSKFIFGLPNLMFTNALLEARQLEKKIMEPSRS